MVSYHIVLYRVLLYGNIYIYCIFIYIPNRTKEWYHIPNFFKISYRNILYLTILYPIVLYSNIYSYLTKLKHGIVFELYSVVSYRTMWYRLQEEAI